MRAASTARSRCSTKYLPQAAAPLRQAAPKITPLKAQATLGIEPVSSTDPRGKRKIKLALDGTAGALRMKLGAEAAGDIATLTLPDFHLDGQIAATDGSALTGLLGLDRALTVDKRAGLHERDDARRERRGRAGRCAPDRGRACGQRQGNGAAVRRSALGAGARSDAAGGRHEPAAARRRGARDRRCCRSRCARG